MTSPILCVEHDQRRAVMATVKELFNAYRENELPIEGGYIVCSFFDPRSTYSRYEVTSYNNAKNIRNSGDGLTFLADGRKIFMLVEPMSYPEKHVEPASRDEFHRVPYRFREVMTFTTKRQDRIMVGKTPVVSRGTFTILKPQGNDFSYIFYGTEGVQYAIQDLFFKSLWQDANVPRSDAEKAARSILKIFEDFVECKAA
jgi:hypothetical protein